MIGYEEVDVTNSKSLYLVASLDYYSVDLAIKTLTKGLTVIDMNFSKVDFKNVININELDSLIQTFPIIDAHRVIVIENVDFKSKVYKELLKLKVPKSTKILIPYYLTRRDNLKKDKIVSAIEKMSCAEVVYQNIDKTRIIELAEKLGLEFKINRVLVNRLMSLDNMDVIKNDMIKICSIADGVITEDIIDAVISKSNELDMFDLIDAISKKNLSLVISLLNNLRDKGENEVSITIRLKNKFRELYYIKSYVIQGLNDKTISYKLNCHPYVALLGVKAVKNFSMESLENAFMKLSEAEVKYKSGYKSDLLTTTLIEVLSLQ